ncbi:unnamed protein product [Plutella xylostella]|uniref:(diamondback moth) hypothetical protein n=1 Tax=Plutella xylostella TaxID=51655 RepID=A0A8S4E761_PLUXY|nr:unnamed protein product [Plutella xylostella]
MQTIVIFAGLVAVALAALTPPTEEFKTVDAVRAEQQKKVIELLQNVQQMNKSFDYYKIGYSYDIAANIENYTNKKAVEEFLHIHDNRINVQQMPFTIFNDRMREEAIALYRVFYYAKDFETFYKTAAWARVWINEGMFVYSFSIAVLTRPDTVLMVLPTPYEIYPYHFFNADVVNKVRRAKMQEGFIQTEVAEKYGITYENNVYTVLANYSGWSHFDNEEQKIAYFTEDIGLNSFYYYFHAVFPFWMKDNETTSPFTERRGEAFYYFYQQLLARYYMERLTNGLGEIPEFSWKLPVKTGYTPNLVAHTLYPFVTRNNYYNLQTPANAHALQYLESFEENFMHMLEQGYFKGDKKEVNLKNWKSINFVGNYWGFNVDLYKSGTKNFQKYYEVIARELLGAAPEPTDEYYTAPVALEQYTTALRDPVFYQLYKHILYYFQQYKQYLDPYTKETLSFTGVKVNDVKVDHLTTFFDYFKSDVSNLIQRNQAEHKDVKAWFHAIQPRLNNKPFNVEIEVKSEVATDAVVRIFLGPKYDSNGYPISLEDNWMNFMTLDTFNYKLTQGKNQIVRNSEHFLSFADDAYTTYDLLNFLKENKVPTDMSEASFFMPRRLMLPKGTESGFPFQIYVIVSPHVPTTGAYKNFRGFFWDNKPFGFPFDRPVNELYFWQSNMFMKDVKIYHEGESNVYKFAVPQYHSNFVTKH